MLCWSLGSGSSAWAWAWPADGEVLRGFSLSGDTYAAGQHRGVDVALGGSAVRAPAAGEVTFAGSVPMNGTTVTISFAEYKVSLTHLGALRVRRGADVAEGDAIAEPGPTGEAEHAIPYVHLGVRFGPGESYVDPLSLLPPRGASHPPPAPEAPPAPPPLPDPGATTSESPADPEIDPAPEPAPPVAASDGAREPEPGGIVLEPEAPPPSPGIRIGSSSQAPAARTARSQSATGSRSPSAAALRRSGIRQAESRGERMRPGSTNVSASRRTRPTPRRATGVRTPHVPLVLIADDPPHALPSVAATSPRR